jgi:hypothetical protein
MGEISAAAADSEPEEADEDEAKDEDGADGADGVLDKDMEAAVEAEGVRAGEGAGPDAAADTATGL